MRCFLAIELPESARGTLAGLQVLIGNEYAKIRWVAPKNIHLTLKFLGELDELEIKLMKDALKLVSYKSFNCRLGKLGWFPHDESINVLWVGLEPEREILKLHGDIELALGSLFEKDKLFSVHVTLGRVKFVKQKVHFLKLLRGINVPECVFPVVSFALIKSDLTKDGPRYTVLERYAFL